MKKFQIITNIEVLNVYEFWDLLQRKGRVVAHRLFNCAEMDTNSEKFMEMLHREIDPAHSHPTVYYYDSVKKEVVFEYWPVEYKATELQFCGEYEGEDRPLSNAFSDLFAIVKKNVY